MLVYRDLTVSPHSGHKLHLNWSTNMSSFHRIALMMRIKSLVWSPVQSCFWKFFYEPVLEYFPFALCPHQSSSENGITLMTLKVCWNLLLCVRSLNVKRERLCPCFVCSCLTSTYVLKSELQRSNMANVRVVFGWCFTKPFFVTVTDFFKSPLSVPSFPAIC